MNEDLVTRRYTSGEYAERNPDWDCGDSPWKAAHVAEMIERHSLSPSSITEIGCGAGGILLILKTIFPKTRMTGYDIAPQLSAFWDAKQASGIRFVLGDYFDQATDVPDLILLLDVIEHLGAPYDFLPRLRDRSRLVIFHIPLDLSSVSVLREAPLLYVRHKVGHLHYFTRSLALAMLDECGFEVVDARYTGASYNSPGRRLKTRIAAAFRKVAYTCFGDAAVRLLGGETLIVLARSKLSS